LPWYFTHIILYFNHINSLNYSFFLYLTTHLLFNSLHYISLCYLHILMQRFSVSFSL
jgi:hypothetical protein